MLWLQNIPLYQKAGAGLAAGGLGALVGSPADLSLIRMQADSTLPEAQRRHYKGVGDALTRIVKDEGAIGLFRGAGPTVTRAMALNMGMLASNDQVRKCFMSEKDVLKGYSRCILQQHARAALLLESQHFCTKACYEGP